MAISEFASIDSVVAEASSTIKSVTEAEKVLMRQFAFRALMKIGVGNLNIKVSDPIAISDWSFAKPADLFKIIDLALIDSTGAEIVTNFKGRAQVETAESLSRIHQDVRQTKLALNISEDDNFFNVEEFTDTAPDDITLVLRYYAFPVDANGMPKIPEIAVMAVIAYIRYNWAMRERRSLAEIQETRHTWLQERASADAEMHTPSMLEGKEIAKGLNSMIQKVVVRDRQY